MQKIGKLGHMTQTINFLNLAFCLVYLSEISRWYMYISIFDDFIQWYQVQNHSAGLG